MKRIILLLAIFIYGGAGKVCAQYADTLSISERVEYIISQLTLDEKLSLMEHHNPAIERLGLQEYSWWNEALHGVGRNGLATVWPMPP